MSSGRTKEDVLMRPPASEGEEIYMKMTVHLGWLKAFQVGAYLQMVGKGSLSFCYRRHSRWTLREEPLRSHITWDYWETPVRTKNMTKIYCVKLHNKSTGSSSQVSNKPWQMQVWEIKSYRTETDIWCVSQQVFLQNKEQRNTNK